MALEELRHFMSLSDCFVFVAESHSTHNSDFFFYLALIFHTLLSLSLPPPSLLFSSLFIEIRNFPSSPYRLLSFLILSFLSYVSKIPILFMFRSIFLSVPLYSDDSNYCHHIFSFSFQTSSPIMSPLLLTFHHTIEIALHTCDLV
jgi:hypothetical protein